MINTEGWELRIIKKTVHILKERERERERERELGLILNADSHTKYNSQIR